MPDQPDQHIRVQPPRDRLTLASVAWVLILIIGLTSFLGASSTPVRKRSKSDRDIAKIGHRKLGNGPQNFYSLEKEKEIGAEESSEFERSTRLLDDPPTNAYLDNLAQAIARNSDAKFPITLGVIDCDDLYALTLPAGYQYITRGLLLRVQSEGELASALARGIAHTALRSATMESTKEIVSKLATVPLIFVGGNSSTSNTPGASNAIPPLPILMFRREDELDADYFGIQYLYKAGYRTDCFLNFMQTAWPQNQEPVLKSFSAFPPLRDRIEAVQEEIGKILPQRPGDIISTPQFAEFQAHLRSVTRAEKSPN